MTDNRSDRLRIAALGPTDITTVITRVSWGSDLMDMPKDLPVTPPNRQGSRGHYGPSLARPKIGIVASQPLGP